MRKDNERTKSSPSLTRSSVLSKVKSTGSSTHQFSHAKLMYVNLAHSHEVLRWTWLLDLSGVTRKVKVTTAAPQTLRGQ